MIGRVRRWFGTLLRFFRGRFFFVIGAVGLLAVIALALANLVPVFNLLVAAGVFGTVCLVGQFLTSHHRMQQQLVREEALREQLERQLRETKSRSSHLNTFSVAVDLSVITATFEETFCCHERLDKDLSVLPEAPEAAGNPAPLPAYRFLGALRTTVSRKYGIDLHRLRLFQDDEARVVRVCGLEPTLTGYGDVLDPKWQHKIWLRRGWLGGWSEETPPGADERAERIRNEFVERVRSEASPPRWIAAAIERMAEAVMREYLLPPGFLLERVAAADDRFLLLHDFHARHGGPGEGPPALTGPT